MTRRKTHAPLNVLLNNRLVGRLEKETSGAIRFQYDKTWLGRDNNLAVSHSLPLRPAAYRGAPVVAVFENLLPDNERVRQRLAERTGADGIDAYSLLERIGRDCVGALQFLPDGVNADTLATTRGEPISDREIEASSTILNSPPSALTPNMSFAFQLLAHRKRQLSCSMKDNGNGPWEQRQPHTF